MDEHLRRMEVRDENMLHLHHHHDGQAEFQVLRRFRSSVAFCRLVHFVADVCEASRGKSVSEAAETHKHSTGVARLLALLDKIESLVAQVEPLKTVTRFGNPAFKTLIGALQEQIGSDLPDEVRAYLLAGLGDATRVDYGTGHELSFLCFLCCCRLTGVVDESEMTGVALLVLPKYFNLVHLLQKRYLLEPAGSRGCWGLDDYQFAPYLVGAAQLSGHPRLRPKSVMDADIRSMFGPEYIYLAAVDHVHTLKVTSFAEHSPMLYDITSVKDWASVYRGLMSMYNREVLGKHPIVQHFVFSSLLPADAASEEELEKVNARIPVSAADKRLGPVAAEPVHHVPCCSDALKFPSTLGAKE